MFRCLHIHYLTLALCCLGNKRAILPVKSLAGKINSSHFRGSEITRVDDADDDVHDTNDDADQKCKTQLDICARALIVATWAD